MSDLAIRVEYLSKRYQLGQRESYKSLREAVARAAAAPLNRLRQRGQAQARQEARTFWALDDVSFEVKQGEAMGIIGRNGAGKSTLLKILSRITKPTTGRAEIYGRVGSLLEVGTGFHPELTGRENIYLNGAILGMKRAEITRKFDEIVAFSEIERFMDTPVKHYSSGMYVRLAFAVAAHLEPEILLVDEVLAVGDVSFQKKCLGKMGDVAHEGRTVLFVSHNMSVITRLCNRAIWLDNGQLRADDSSELVVHQYITLGSTTTAEKNWDNPLNAPGDSIAKLKAVRILDANRKVSEIVQIDEPCYIEIEYWHLQSQLKPTAIVHLYNDDGTCLFATNDWNNLEWRSTLRKPGLIRATCQIPSNLLAEGHMSVLAAINTYNPEAIHVYEKDIITFQVIDRTEGQGARGEYVGGRWPGVMRPLLNWDVMYIEDSLKSPNKS